MQINTNEQAGGSAIINLIILAIVAYGIFIGIQYTPQWIESRSIQSILDEMERMQGMDPVTSTQEARDKVTKMLQINEMNDLIDSFNVSRASDHMVVKFGYDRQLNMIYATKPIRYEQTLSLYVRQR